MSSVCAQCGRASGKRIVTSTEDSLQRVCDCMWNVETEILKTSELNHRSRNERNEVRCGRLSPTRPVSLMIGERIRTFPFSVGLKRSPPPPGRNTRTFGYFEVIFTKYIKKNIGLLARAYSAVQQLSVNISPMIILSKSKSQGKDSWNVTRRN